MSRDQSSVELPDSASNAEGSNRRSRRLFRRLCLLLLVMLVVPVVIIGYRYQQQMAFIDKYGFEDAYAGPNVKTIPHGPDWLREFVGEERMLGFDRIISIADLPEAATVDLELLARHPVRELHLFETDMTDSVIRDLGQLKELEKLELARCAPISQELLIELSKLKHLKELEITYRLSKVLQYKPVHPNNSTRAILDEFLTWNRFNSQPETRFTLDSSFATQSLRYLRNLSSLRSLSFRGLELTDECLVEIGQLTQLESLDLSDTAITDDGLLHLAMLPNLKELKLDQTSVTDEGIKHFDGHAALRLLMLDKTNITDDVFEWMKKHLPDCTLILHSHAKLDLVIRH